MSLKNRRERSEYEQTREGFSPPGYSPTYTGKRGRRGRFVGPVLIVCAIVAMLVAGDYWLNSGKIYRGVKVGSVSLGGEKPTAAREIVRERALGALKEIELSGPEQFTRTAAEMGVNFNVGATVEKAYAVGREGNILERLQERLRATFVGITIPPDVDYRPAKARAEVEEIASRVNHEPRGASVNIVGSEVEVVESREGYKLDNAATLASVDSAVDDVSGEAKLVGEVLKPEITTEEAEVAAEKARGALSEQVVLKTDGKSWTLSPADIGSTLDITREDGKHQVDLSQARLADRLANVYADLTVEPVEAGYDLGSSGVSVTPSKEGQNIESEKFLGAIEEGIFEGKREFQVPIEVNEPELTTAEAEEMKPTELLGSYRTNYSIVEDPDGLRAENLEIASSAVSGTFLAPGEVFSMNDTVSALDYHATHVIINGQETTEEGGGLCQVTSTLYNAVNFAGLNVIERHPHASQLPYIRPGMDATVWFGALDMRFENTTEGYVLLEEYVSDDGYIYASVYGVPDNVDVEVWSEPVYRTPDAAKWVTYMTRTENGEVTYDGELHTDTYDALIDEHGKKLEADEIPIAPVTP
ncbi:MAG: VanW family protein [Actinomycetota bacterium]|nr:VanW family protein [Actinomycetota bacterium]